MGLLDAPVLAAARTVLDLLGTAATLEIAEPGSYDTATGVASATPDKVAVKVRLESMKASASQGIRVGDMLATIAGNALVADPKTGDRLVVPGRGTFDVVDSKPVMATDEIAIYELQVRR